MDKKQILNNKQHSLKGLDRTNMYLYKAGFHQNFCFYVPNRVNIYKGAENANRSASNKCCAIGKEKSQTKLTKIKTERGYIVCE